VIGVRGGLWGGRGPATGRGLGGGNARHAGGVPAPGGPQGGAVPRRAGPAGERKREEQGGHDAGRVFVIQMCDAFARRRGKPTTNHSGSRTCINKTQINTSRGGCQSMGKIPKIRTFQSSCRTPLSSHRRVLETGSRVPGPAPGQNERTNKHLKLPGSRGPAPGGGGGPRGDGGVVRGGGLQPPAAPPAHDRPGAAGSIREMGFRG